MLRSALGDYSGVRLAKARAASEGGQPGDQVDVKRPVAEFFAAPRFRAILVALFGAVALSLALAGIYGVMAYTVAQKSREIGLRMALGATAQGVLWMVLRRGAQTKLPDQWNETERAPGMEEVHRLAGK